MLNLKIYFEHKISVEVKHFGHRNVKKFCNKLKMDTGNAVMLSMALLSGPRSCLKTNYGSIIGLIYTVSEKKEAIFSTISLAFLDRFS